MSVRKLSPELEKKVVEDYGESAMRLSDGIISIKEWIAKQPHLVNNVRTDDQWIAAFIRGCKYRIEMAKSKLEMYYTLRTALPHLHQPMDPFLPVMQTLLSNGSMLILPNLSAKDSPRILFYRTSRFKSELSTADEEACYHQMIYMYLMLKDDNAVISGLDFIIDTADTPSEIIKNITVQNIKISMAIGEKALPFRYKSMSYLNCPPTTEIVFNFIKGFMNEKSKKRLFVYSDVEGVYEKYPKHLLPKEYGGDSYTIQDAIDFTKKKIESLSNIYVQEKDYKSNESLRPGKSVIDDSLFGIDGNFRKLEYD